MRNSDNLELQARYWNDPAAKAAFKQFMITIHGLDFKAWDEADLWDEAYTPFSYFKDGQVISNVCVYLLDAVINGASTRVAQISGVGTLEVWRRQGLSRSLTQAALEWATGKYAGLFLFADEEAIPYYQQTGFTEFPEYLEWVTAIPSVRRSGLKQLTPKQPSDLKKIIKLAASREPISNRFSVLNHRLLGFHALYTLHDCAYEIQDLNLILFYRRDEEKIVIYDILAPQIPPFEEIYPYLAEPTDRQIEFRFFTDKLSIANVQQRELVGDNAFTLGSFPVKNVVFPYTSKA